MAEIRWCYLNRRGEPWGFNKNQKPYLHKRVVYTEAEHEEVQRLRALYRVVCGLRLKDGYPLGIARALDKIDGGQYNPKIGDQDVDG